MSNYYLGQIMLAGFDFAPRGFALCNGQLMAISQNNALFSLLGVQFGGDGRTTFALPNLQGRTPAGTGSSVDPAWQPAPYVMGQAAGVESVTVLTSQMPAHSHPLNASATTGTVKAPTNALYGGSGAESFYAANAHPVPLAPSMVGPSGGNTAHDNIQPVSVLGFSIALSGIYPSRA
jgi:microcystin-dependent protein